jgi:hypothetical protein
MNIEKIIASQVKLGYLIPAKNGSYRINKEEFYWEMARRVSDTELETVSVKEYREKLGGLGVWLVG